MVWTPIRTMRRGDRPDFTLLRQPPNARTTPAQQWFLDQLLDLEPGSEDADGGGYAHKEGYHDTVAHNDARSGVGGDYSARDPEDRRGPRDKTRGRDWTFRDAQAGNFRDLAEYGDLQLAAYRANDPRLEGWREYLGRVTSPVDVGGTRTRRVGIDFRKRRLRIPDDSHDWHGHFSEDTEQVFSFWNKWALLTVLAGWTVAEWRQSIEGDDMSAEDVKAIRADLARLAQFLTAQPNALFNEDAEGFEWVGSAATLPALKAALARLEQQAAAGEARDNAHLAALNALADVVRAGGGNVDVAAILGEIRTAGAATTAAVAQLQQQLADVVAERDRLHQQLADVLAGASDSTPD